MRNEYEESVSPAVADRTTSADSADTLADTMAEATIVDARRQQAEKPEVAPPAVIEEVLIEEVSIDGMCGVY
jgi:mycofactocin precursor